MTEVEPLTEWWPDGYYGKMYRNRQLLLLALAWAGLGMAGVGLGQDGVVIDEFLCSNTVGIKDVFQNRSDWIEIYNGGSNTVNLSDWSLTDDPGNPAKWTLPATNLPAHAFLLVFASGKSVAVAGGELHASFALNRAGGYLALMRPDLSVASAFNYPPQKADVSFGSSLTEESSGLVSAGATVTYCVPSEAVPMP